MRVAGARPTRRGSMRRALSLWLLLPLMGLVPLAATLLYVVTVRPMLDALDHDLRGTALALADLIVVDRGQVSLPLSEQTARALMTDVDDTILFVVSDPHGRVLTGDADLARSGPAPIAGKWQFFDDTLHGRSVRVAEYGAPCGDAGSQASCLIRVAESAAKREVAKRRVLVGAGSTMLLLAVALVLLARGAIAQGLGPLHRLSGDLESRSLGYLEAVNTAEVPSELVPVVMALNRLLDRLDVASRAQQAFLADAAHQLRTPLTALRTETELALLEPHPPELEATLNRVREGATRAARLANQLLALAQAEHAMHAMHATPPQPENLEKVATDVAQDWVRPALDAGIDLGYELEPAWVMGRAHLLRELLGNLVHNAIAYAGRGARVTVRTSVRQGQAVLEVEDTGPGISEADRQRVWERFQRGDKAPGSGSGLGLSIVRDIAAGHEASIEMRPGAHGLGLMLRLTFRALEMEPKSS